MGWSETLEAPQKNWSDSLSAPDKTATSTMTAPDPKEAQTFSEYLQAGYQGTGLGLLVRGRLPDVSLSENTPWYGRAVAGVGALGADLPVMIPAGAAGASIAAPTGPVGASVSAWTAAGAAPAALRATLMEAYQKGEVRDKSDFIERSLHVAWETFKGGAVGAAARYAGLGVGTSILGKVGIEGQVATKLVAAGESAGKAVPEATAAQVQLAQRTLGSLGSTAKMTVSEAAAMVAAQSALEGKLPAMHDFVDAAILLGGFKGVHVTTTKLMDIYKTTGKPPMQVVEEAKSDPRIAEELTAPKEMLRTQDELFEMRARLNELDAKEQPSPAEITERDALKTRVSELETLGKQKDELLAKQMPGLERIYSDVRSQMLEAGRPESEATSIAILERERYRSRATRLAVDPWNLYSGADLKIRGEEPDVSAHTSTVKNIAPQEVPLEKLSLSKDVPQFKANADEKGVVEPLSGTFDTTDVGPIQVWERNNGRLEIISGRHRFDLAKRSGRDTISAQIHKESEGFTANKAQTLDAVLNIRSGHGSTADFANYFRSTGVSESDANSAGLLGRAKGRIGYAIARDASPDVFAAHSAGHLTSDAALSISQAAPGNSAVQAVGLKLVNEGKSILFATNMMRALGVMSKENGTGDLFGFDESGMRDAEAMAQKASRQQRAIAEQIRAVQGAANRPEIARKMGVDVKDPEAIKAKIAELKHEQYLWDNWPLYPELVARLKELNQESNKETPTELTARDLEAFNAARRKVDPLSQETDTKNRGSYLPAENLIRLFKSADQSTALHELGHSWLEEMRLDALHKDAPPQIKADWDILRRELAIPENGEIGVASHEQFARSVERYVAEGKAPSPELQGVFDRFREWLTNIYRELMNLRVEISPEMKGVLDRMLSIEDQGREARDLGVPRAYVDLAKEEKRRQIVPGDEAKKIASNPYADELPPGPGEAPDNIHVNYKYINSPTDLKLAMQKMAEISQGHIQELRGGKDGVKTWADANAEQARYVNDILDGTEDTLRLLSPDPNSAKVDVKLGVLKKLAIGAVRDSARLRDIILEKGDNATVQEQLDYMGSIERARMIQAEFLGERAAVARALNALKDMTEGTGEIGRMLEVIGRGELYQSPAEIAAGLKQKLSEIMLNYGGRTPLEIAKLHKEVGTIKGTFKFTKGVTESTTMDKILEGWRAGLLSGPVTHVTNLLGTGVFQVLRAPLDIIAAGIGAARGAKVGVGESDRASMMESVSRLHGYLGGALDGLKVGYHAFKVDEATPKTEQFKNAIEGTKGDIIRIPLRLMAAEDAMVNTMYQRGELRTLAMRKAFDEGLNPTTREFSERIDYLLDHPTAEMKTEAETQATRMTFNAPSGEIISRLQLLLAKAPALKFIIPFVRTPVNITKEVGRLTPLAPFVKEWRNDFNKGGVAKDRALAEIALGTGIMSVVMAYAFAGESPGAEVAISGAGSPDPKKKAGKQAAGWQPYSIRLGDTWYSYQRLQPFGTIIGMAADIAEMWDHMTDEEQDKVPKMATVAFANAVTNQTFLQGITTVVNAMSDPKRFGPQFARNFAASMVPNIIGQPTAMMDPYTREVNSVVDAVKARIPGQREELLKKLDPLGQPIETKEKLGVVSPVTESRVSEDNVRLEMSRLGVAPAPAPKKLHIGKGTGKFGEVELTPEQRQTYTKVSGEMAYKILDKVVNSPNWERVPDILKKKVFERAFVASHRLGAISALPPEQRTGILLEAAERMQEELQ